MVKRQILSTSLIGMMNIDRRGNWYADDRPRSEQGEAEMDQHRFRNLLEADTPTQPANVGSSSGFVACPACLWAAVPMDARLWQHQLYQLAYLRALEERLASVSRAAVGFSWN
jgi:hypothetical protein